ncbi:MAG: hypothetical protein JXQ73_32795 [Phycisphaerae bacterium]|nr:hypothetical protein [Phycisphaerae bacterium]
MLRFRLSPIVWGTTLAVLLSVADPVAADDFWRTAARGLQFAGWAPPTGDIGVSRHVFGDGWTVQTTRQLSAVDLYGGIVGIELRPGVDPTTGASTPVSLYTETSIRNWGIPSARFRIATEQTGSLDNVVPVQYNLWLNTGAQDIRVEGQGSLEAQIDINLLGFYDIDAYVTNRGTFEIDGVLYSDSGSTDYDLGPISLSGNIFVDALAALTAPLFAGADVSNPLAVFSGRAKLQNELKQRDMLVARLESGEILSDEEMAQILNTSMMEVLFGGEGSPLIEMAKQQYGNLTSQQQTGVETGAPLYIPEPVSVGLWLALAVAVGIRRRRT